MAEAYKSEDADGHKGIIMFLTQEEAQFVRNVFGHTHTLKMPDEFCRMVSSVWNALNDITKPDRNAEFCIKRRDA